MNELGGKLVLLDVPKRSVLKGGKQVAFHKNDYKVISKISPVAYD